MSCTPSARRLHASVRPGPVLGDLHGLGQERASATSQVAHESSAQRFWATVIWSALISMAHTAPVGPTHRATSDVRKPPPQPMHEPLYLVFGPFRLDLRDERLMKVALASPLLLTPLGRLRHGAARCTDPFLGFVGTFSCGRIDNLAVVFLLLPDQ